MFTDEISKFSSAARLTPEDMNEPEPEILRQDPLDDVFGSTGEDAIGAEQPSSHNEISDVPRLQGLHTTNGYREGVAVSKEKFMQEGFDEGYALGAEIGAVAGKIIGLLEALVTALQSDEERKRISDTLIQAKTELSVKNLYAEEYFGEDGIWKFKVLGEDGDAEEENVTFRLVASNHPLIRKWHRTVNELLGKYGLGRSI